MYKIYGIPNCDTMKKAMDWLKKNKIPFEFHNYKTEGITPAKLRSWCRHAGWEQILNKKSATWRALDAKVQASITNEKAAVTIMTEHTSCIKRPVLEKDGAFLLAGFDTARYGDLIIEK